MKTNTIRRINISKITEHNIKEAHFIYLTILYIWVFFSKKVFWTPCKADTIRNNIGYSKDDATAEEIFAAAKAAYANEFIESFPEKYDTLCGERGVKLSGGQKQRITIARALLKNPPILILDEATSALDTESERIVQKALDNLMKGRTSFVVAHRLSTILNADMIVVFNKGQIEAIGKHEEIVKTSATYKRLYEMQFRIEQEEKIADNK